MTISLRAAIRRLLFASVMCVAASAADDAASAWSVPAAERQALVAVVDRAIAAGMPDAKGGKLYAGMLKLTTPEQAKAAEGKGQAGSQSIGGLHLKLADGTWVVSLQRPLAGSQITVVEQGLSEVPVDQVLAKAKEHAKQQQWGAHLEAGLDEQLKHFAADQRDMLRSIRDLMSMQMYIQSNGDMTMATAHLIRLGMPRAEELSALSSAMLLWNDEAVAICEGKPSRLRLLSGNLMAEWQERQARFETATDLRLPPLAHSLRRLLAMQFYNQLTGSVPKSFPVLAPADAIKLIEAVLADDPGLPGMRPELARLVERAALPQVAAEGADLAARLAVWGRNEGDPQMDFYDDESLAAYAEMDDAQLEHMPENIREAVKRLKKGVEFRESDMGGLVALAGDRRPSRWLDFGRFRTVGDNALRALAEIMGCDPRALIKRDAAAPWTDAERDATASALAAWWKDNQGKPLATIIAGVVDQMALSDLARQLKRTDEQQRGALLDLVAKAWATKAPTVADPNALAQILVAAKGHAGVTAVVTTWPVEGRSQLLLAAWRVGTGDGKPFDQLLEAELKSVAAAKPDAKPAKPGIQMSMLPSLLAIAYRHPDAGRLQRVLAALAGPLDGPQGLMQALTTAMYGGMNGELNTLWGKDRMMGGRGKPKPGEDDRPVKAASALPLAVFGTLLKDARPAPKQLADQYARQAGARVVKKPDGTAEAPKATATDLRISDIAAVMFAQQGWNLQLDKLIGNEAQQRLMKQRIDLTTGQEERDRVITEQRRLIAEALPPALKAAGLPEMLPGLTEVQQAGDDKAAF